MSFFAGMSVVPPLEVFHLNDLYNKNSSADKVNLTIGAYRDENGDPWVLPVVRKVKSEIASEPARNYEYLSVLGMKEYTRAATELVLGEESEAVREGRASGIQTISGTSALRIAAEIMRDVLGIRVYYICTPTWSAHPLMGERMGFDLREYSYWDGERRRVDMEGILRALEGAPERSAVLLHACAHNPTGMDPSREEWKEICEVVKKRRLFTVFDFAYQGFASGDPAEDAWAIRYFVSQGLEMMIAQSFSKNMGLYSERTGNLTIVSNDASSVKAIRSQVLLRSRSNFGSAPALGCQIVHKVLTTPSLKAEWIESIKTMSSRIKEMRAALRAELEKLETPGDWSHITEQIGMFSYTGLNPKQAQMLMDKHSVFLPLDGRISIGGLTMANVEYVARAIDDVIRTESGDRAAARG